MQTLNYKYPNSNVADAPLLEKLPFQLQNGEKIIREIKPQFLGFMISRAFGSYVWLAALVILAIISISTIVFSNVLVGIISVILLGRIIVGFSIGIIAILLTLLALISIGPFLAYSKSWYWITNYRVIGKRGTLSYSIDSIPLENVTDIVLSRTILDRLLGLSSLIIVPMGTSAKENGGSPDERAKNANFFPALAEDLAKELQRVLFNLRDELKRSMVQPVFITPAPKTAGTPASSSQSVFITLDSKKENTPAQASSEKEQPKSVLPRGTT